VSCGRWTAYEIHHDHVLDEVDFFKLMQCRQCQRNKTDVNPQVPNLSALSRIDQVTVLDASMDRSILNTKEHKESLIYMMITMLKLHLHIVEDDDSRNAQSKFDR
jgi:hypothetical protein